MLTHERSLNSDFADSDFAVVGVNGDLNIKSARSSAEKFGVSWTSFFDGKHGPIARLWNVNNGRATFLIDQQGIIRARNFQFKQYEDVVTLVTNLLR